MKLEAEQTEKRLEEAKQRREENERFQGTFVRRSSYDADSVVEMKADNPFGLK